MADNRSVLITLRLENKTENKADTSNQIVSTEETSENYKNGISGGMSAGIKGWAAIQIISTVVNEGLAWANYYVDRELMLNDDYVGQRNKQIATTQINRGINVVSSIARSTAYGAMLGGPMGAAIGFAISSVQQVAAIARSNIQGRDQQDIQIRQMTAQLEFTRSRVGWSLNAASIGEDL